MLKRFDTGRLKVLLGLFFFALAVPTGVLIWQAYSQLKWEAFHQYRGLAEELTVRIDRSLSDLMRKADERSFADYAFLNVSGDTVFNYLQRSPLSGYPVMSDIPGLIGHFQVDSEGRFSSPLLPPATSDAAQLGIDAGELSARRALVQQIESILADNRLVRAVPASAQRGDLAESLAEEKAQADRRDDVTAGISAARRSPNTSLDDARPTPAAGDSVVQDPIRGRQSTAAAPALAADAFPRAGAATEPQHYSQQAFDSLNSPLEAVAEMEMSGRRPAPPGDPAAGNATEERGHAIARVSELDLDADLQQKSEVLEVASEEQRPGFARDATPDRAKRREQSALVADGAAVENEAAPDAFGPSGLRIDTFESEIDPFEFSLLGSGHFVLFRNVWQNGERYVQGFLLDRAEFVGAAVERSFRDSVLSGMSNLIVGYEDEVIGVFPGAGNDDYASAAGALRGALLYRSRLSAPLDRLEVIFSVNRLPRAPGATVLSWVTVVLAIVLVGGFFVMYRLGQSQIGLARQQQDFVSAVSHELKTPLTSIRMYGEMLREGWADDAKRQDYYEFIHDEAERLTRMIANVLQLANITRNDPSYDLRPVSAGELLANVESKIANQVKRAGFALQFEQNDDAAGAVLNLDVDCFAQIVINLVDNAIKFSRDAETKTVVIGCESLRDGQVRFTIRDHGPGIRKDQMKKIFRLFYRSESELTREAVGTGIGLAIVHQLVTAMHGQVDVVNRHPGAEFRLIFPAVANRAVNGGPASPANA